MKRAFMEWLAEIQQVSDAELAPFAYVGPFILGGDLARGTYRHACAGLAFWPRTHFEFTFTFLLVLLFAALFVWRVDEPLARTGWGVLLLYQIVRAHWFFTGHPYPGWVNLIKIVATVLLTASVVRSKRWRGALVAGVVFLAVFLVAWTSLRQWDSALGRRSVLHSTPGC